MKSRNNRKMYNKSSKRNKKISQKKYKKIKKTRRNNQKGGADYSSITQIPLGAVTNEIIVKMSNKLTRQNSELNEKLNIILSKLDNTQINNKLDMILSKLNNTDN